MNHIPPCDVPLVEFPHSLSTTSGMRVIESSADPVYGTVQLNVPYAEKSGKTLRLQIISPPLTEGSEQQFPCVVWVQGSAWFAQNLGQELPGLIDFAKRGYVVAIVEYRPSALAPFPAQIKDVKSAVRFLREHALDHHIDPIRMAIWGDSSGGHTAVMTALTQEAQEYSDEPITEELGLRCVIDFYGPTDISQMNAQPSIMDHVSPDSPEGMLIGGLNVLEHPAAVAPTVVMNHVPRDRRLPPMLIIHGSKDRLVPFDQSVLLYEALTAAQQPVVFYQIFGADHAGPAFWQPAVLDLVDKFLQDNLAEAGL